MTLLQTTIGFTIGTTELLGVLGSLVSLLVGAGVAVFRLFVGIQSRLTEVENEVEKERRVSETMFNVITKQLDEVQAEQKETRKGISNILAKLK